MEIEFIRQGPENPGAILKAAQQIARCARFNRVTGLYAYATLGGAQLLIDAMRSAFEDWQRARKRWVVSIDFGRTDPKALELLAEIDNSDVRIPNAELLLNRRLMPKVCFHPKTLLLDSLATTYQPPVGIVVGSGNMSYSGLSIGEEHAIAISIQRSTKHRAPILSANTIRNISLAEVAFSNATKLSLTLIRRYKKLYPAQARHAILLEPEQMGRIVVPRPELSPFTGMEMASARNLWIEIDYVVHNLGVSRPGNQIDMARGSRIFFGCSAKHVPTNTYLGAIRIRYGGKITECHIRFGNNSMDKLNLPLPDDGGPPRYDKETLLFTRVGQNTYDLSIGKYREIAAWKRRSKVQGTLYTLKSGRQYGCFN